MTIERAIEILDPEHRENYDSIEPVNEACRMGIEALKRERWIPVTERLPELWRNDETAELVNYMIYSPDFGVDIGNYHAKAKKWLCMGLPCTVTHWMPLPEAPTRPKKDLPTHIDIRSSAKPSVALCEQVTTVSTERIGSYVGSCTEQELVMLEAALAISLNIACGEPRVVEKVVEKIVEKPVPAEESRLPFADDGGEAVIRLETERDMYKNLYEQMLERLLARA